MVQALTNFFATSEEFEVVGTATDGVEGLAACHELGPELVLMDLQMPRMNGVEATGRIVEECPGVKVVVLTTFASLDFVLPALRAGASGFLVKDAEPDRILSALRLVANGEENMPISPQVVKLLADEAVGGSTEHKRHGRAPGPTVRLTTRESELLTLLAQGLNNREMAAGMGVSEGSVKAYLGRICEKLEVRDRLQALIRAYELGLVKPKLAGEED
ncbi:DNA-binding response regulator, NarL/FixJ family, contains REC and HTH domains [Raineyella antarctica]|uniref:DNA-binding response regulator, NarL/FixJ family, contains REC and HTH domains n=2 Tax=Raineyella antarctica TaxID=1577474 RepID=A0A1G6GFD1_9ACTN|nr:DNA-binding response regulator, NarL/FixJ family, contains REC and HTH domains [Raineyella antarctica]